MQAAASAMAHGPLRNGLRKGTHSCLECRRRKVRCIFDLDSPRCRECHTRGVECTQQVRELKPKSSQDESGTLKRVRDLEALVSRITATLPASESTSVLRALEDISSDTSIHSVANPSGAAVTRTSSLSIPPSEASAPEPPALALFNNGVLWHDLDRIEPKGNIEGIPSAKTRQILSELKCLLPESHSLSLVLEQSTDSWRLWHNTFRDLEQEPGSSNVVSLRNFIYTSINSHDLGLVVKVILCLAIHIQQLPLQFTSTQPKLPLSLKSLENRYLSAAQSILDSSEGVVETLDGLSCMLIQMEYYINEGKPRKVWLILRRAISIAQLLGLSRTLSEACQDEGAAGKSLFMKLWLTDRELSLILGLPFGVPDSFVGVDIDATADTPGGTEESFLLKLGAVAGRITHRNQTRRKLPYSATLDIDQELEECHDRMPETWWQTLPGPDLSTEENFTMLTIKLKYFNVRKLLHLPFMLKAYDDRRYQPSRHSTLEAARDMIRTYQILRGSAGNMLKMCAMVDFEVFTAAMILVIDLLAPAQQDHQPPQQPREDRDLVKSLAVDLRRVSEIVACQVAQQAADLLEDFLRAVQSPSQEYGEVYEAKIPYFGKLYIRRKGTAVQSKTSNTPTQHEPPETARTAAGQPEYSGPIVSFEDYLHGAPQMTPSGRNASSAWLSNFAVDHDWSWTANGMNDP